MRIHVNRFGVGVESPATQSEPFNVLATSYVHMLLGERQPNGSTVYKIPSTDIEIVVTNDSILTYTTPHYTD